jgi:hypothetical protein
LPFLVLLRLKTIPRVGPLQRGRITVEAIDQARPNYILILPWNLKDEIIHQMHHVAAWGAKFVVPIPFVTVIDPSELRK